MRLVSKILFFLIFLLTSVIGSIFLLFVEVMILVQLPWVKNLQGKTSGGVIELILITIVLVSIPQYFILNLVSKKFSKAVSTSVLEKIALTVAGTLIVHLLFRGVSNSWMGMWSLTVSLTKEGFVGIMIRSSREVPLSFSWITPFFLEQTIIIRSCSSSTYGTGAF